MKTLVLLFSLLLPVCLFAFNPPTDTQGRVTLSVDGVPQKTATDRPLAFTVRLQNGSDKTVAGTVLVELNDDWQVVGTNAFPVSVAPGQAWQAACSATARERVLSALYPVHARLTLVGDGEPIELHPIAVFMAERPAAQVPPPVSLPPALTSGVWNLARITPTASAWARNGHTTQMPAGFMGGDPESGATFGRDDIVRGDVARHCLSIHPPWKGGYGTLWSDYRLTLPANGPARLKVFTAIRDSAPTEPKSDGVDFRIWVIDAANAEHPLFARFSDAKTWQQADVDLSAFAGQTITLRFWNGPGPKNDTTCDNGFWGDPTLFVGPMPPDATDAERAARTEEALRLAKAAIAAKPRVPNAFSLKGETERCGAAVVLGREGLTDAVIAFSDGSREVAFRGFNVEVDGQPVGFARDGQLVQRVDAASQGTAWVVTHTLPTADGKQQLLRATLRADHGALRIAWDMPGTARTARGTPRYTKLALGPSSQKAARIYLGFGAVYEDPGAFSLPYGGVQLGTRHIGADYANGISLVQATDLIPDRVTCFPSQSTFSLETSHDACFMLVPSAQGAYAAARAYRGVCGFGKAGGVDVLLGRVCLDQWGGDYRDAAKDLDRAAKYGLNHSLFVKHGWQRWGYDYRLPNIYPPSGGLEPFLEMRNAAKRGGILFAPHDNYIDFYPDADGYSYDCMVFNDDGTPQKAWYNPGPDAQSYRWKPDAFMPWLTANMKTMHTGFDPDALFIDVFTSIPPFDYYDRSGAFHTRAETVKGWCNAFDTCRKLLGHRAPQISESGHDALIGSIDGVEADHWRPECWLATYGDADRTPWHDMVTHGKMVLLAGGLGDRYDPDPAHGYGSDDYLSNTVLGGRSPMCDGPFSRKSVMTYWLLHDACDALAHAEMETHSFGPSVRQQHTTFGRGGEVWANRGSNAWTVANGFVLPQYGFFVKTAKAEAGVVRLAGRRAAFAQSEGAFFADARPQPNPEVGCRVETHVVSSERIGPRAYRVTFAWNVLAPIDPGYVPFIHIGRASETQDERIEAQAGMGIEPAQLAQAGTFQTTAEVRLPADFAAGDYFVRYGLFHAKRGDRLPVSGVEDRNRRLRGGILRITASGDEYLAEGPAGDSPDLNVAGAMLDFGAVATDGAFRLLHGERGAWQLVPLPASRPLRADIRLAAFGAKRAVVKSVEPVDPLFPFAKRPEWKQDGDVLHLSCDALSFGYRIAFE